MREGSFGQGLNQFSGYKDSLGYSHSANVVVLYVIMVCSHEYDVDDDAEGDEELGEWIEDDVGEELTDLDPDGAAVPDA